MPSFSDLTGPLPAGMANPDITGISADSRAIRPGFLFAALPGSQADGRSFIAQAVASGAAAILAPLDTPAPAGVPLLAVAEPRLALALAAARFHGRQPRTIAAVTGTNGKTSVAYFTRQIWQQAGHAAAALGTLGLVVGDDAPVPGLTTPDPVSLHATLADLVGRGVNHLVLEASSHGLDQYRLDGLHLTAAAFTNLTRDHLDYHGDMAAYFAAKAALFDRLLPVGATAVLNRTSDRFDALAAICQTRGQRILSFGGPQADLALLDRQPTARGQSLLLSVLGQRREIDLPIAGGFQADNALAALGLAIATGIESDHALNALTRLTGVPGRLQHVADHGGGAIYVDFAHSPDALETVLHALRPHTAGQLVVIFGCGGDRDRGKRPVMGEIACRLADQVIVTDDNPRSEAPASIRAEILTGCPRAVTEQGDRALAIHQAVAALQPGDVLVIAGKGHEQGQKIGSIVLPFDDAEIARTAARSLETKP